METFETKADRAFDKAFDQFPLPVDYVADQRVDCGLKFGVGIRFYHNDKQYRHAAIGKKGGSLQKAFKALREWADKQII